MVAYSFKKQFVAPIEANAKRQTIRAPRKGRGRHAQTGQTLQLYTAMRTKYCTLIGTATCLSVSSITIDFEHSTIQYTDADGGVTTIYDLDNFAREDGFLDWPSMNAFWAKEHSGVSLFQGALIRWCGFKPA